jgi:hypothetical protein
MDDPYAALTDAAARIQELKQELLDEREDYEKQLIERDEIIAARDDTIAKWEAYQREIASDVNSLISTIDREHP